MDNVTVHKCDVHGRVTLTYHGMLIAHGDGWICLEARFALPDKDAGYHVFRTGDRFVEWFYADRGYNIFALHAADDDRLLGWYCNITRPAHITRTDAAFTVSADDLALDLFVRRDGSTLLLDADEFAALDLSAADRADALSALADLQARVAQREPPFDAIPDPV